jgi:AcrR family transcriptional regulator
MSAATGKSTRPPRAHSTPPGAHGPRKRRKLRKEEILAEATRLFAERGYEGASMGDLAELVGLRKASLFHHFPSKDALYSAVLEQLMDAVKGAILAAATAEGSFDARLEVLTDALTSTLGAQPHAARLLIREAMDTGPVMRDRLGRTINDVLHASHEFAKAGQREGAFNPGIDPAQAIVSIIGVLFMPFIIVDVVERFMGTSPFHASFVDERKAAVREQVRLMVLARKR